MKKLFFAGALCMMLCVCATGMAGTMFNVCLSKECLTEQEAANQAIQTKPEGFKVTRQSVIPWDDAGERWSVLVELENVSEEAITIDDTWLIAYNAREEELARWSVPAIDGAFWKTNRTVRPGERVVLFAGTDEVKTWIADWETKETVEKTVSPAGLSAVAKKSGRQRACRFGLTHGLLLKQRDIWKTLKRQRRGLRTENCIWKRRMRLIPRVLRRSASSLPIRKGACSMRCKAAWQTIRVCWRTAVFPHGKRLRPISRRKWVKTRFLKSPAIKFRKNR